MSSKESIKVSPTFNFEDFDIVIRSRDNVDFNVHKVILKHASEVWRTMLSLPAPAERSNSKQTSANDAQVMELAEDSEMIHTLLCFIYPVAKPVTNTLDSCTSALEVAAKYDVTVAVQLLSQALMLHGMIEKYPLRVFAVATRYGLEDVKKLAYQRLLTFNFTNDTGATEAPELASLSGLDYHLLCHKKIARSNAAIAIIMKEAENLDDGVHFCWACGNFCWFDKYQELVVGRLKDNATSSALLFNEGDIAQVMDGMCSRSDHDLLFIRHFYVIQRSDAFKDMVLQIDALS